MQFTSTFEYITGVENILEAWREFIRGKRGKRDVQEFSLHLMDNIFSLHTDLVNHTYCHGGYQAFNISDPKPRNIHKASVRDRLLHHVIHRTLYPTFDDIFIADSYSCRIDKGTHKALERFKNFGNKASKNNTRTCWILKCDIKKFFANIDHAVLLGILQKYILDQDIIWLLQKVIESFSAGKMGVGLPLGNLTSQLFVNIYMNEFDQWVKHKLKAKHYIRYADDFVFFSEDREVLKKLIPLIEEFLRVKLKLQLHPDKLFIKTLVSGVDFLGWVNFPYHKVLRTTTKRRMFKRIKEHPTPETFASYEGLLSHGNTQKIQKEVSQFVGYSIYLASENDN